MRKSLKAYLLLPSLLIFVIILLFFIGLKVWIALQYNRDGNLLLITCPRQWNLYEITKSKIVVWEFDLSTVKSNRWVAGMAIYATRLKNGNTLIVDPEVNGVYEVNRSRRIVWRCERVKDDDTTGSTLSYPSSAQRLPNGNTLIADNGNERVIEVTRDCRIAWKYICSEDEPHASPTRALKFPDSDIGILVYCRAGFEYREVEPSSNRVIRTINLTRFESPNTAILDNKYVFTALPFPGAGAIEFDSLGNIVWRYEPVAGVLIAGKEVQKELEQPQVNEVYPTSKNNIFIGTTHEDILEVTRSKDVVWKLSADEQIKNILGIRFFYRVAEDNNLESRHVAGVVE